MSDETTIHPRENGPYKVTGCHRLQGMLDGTVYPSDGTVALCRCGASKNKPFCDGTHATNGFSSAKSADRVPDKRDTHGDGELIIHDNRGICAHAARCTDTLSTVFKLGQEPWIDPSGATTEKIIATIEQCPSGALSYSKDGVEPQSHAVDPKILIVPNGPYSVKGGATVDNVTWGEGASREHFTLCRCGHSTNKPFCSGAHWDHHFDEHAPPRTT